MAGSRIDCEISRGRCHGMFDGKLSSNAQMSRRLWEMDLGRRAGVALVA